MDTWNCPGCTFVNAGETTVCGICGAKRDPEEAAAEAEPEPAAHAPALSGADRTASMAVGLASEVWSCPACSFANSMAVRMCGVCGGDNPDAPPPAPEAEDGPQPWNCSQCTFENVAGSAACSLCGAPSTQTPSESAATTYTCASCTLTVDVTSENCPACNAPRPPGVGPSWTCAACTFAENPMTALVCGACSTPAGGTTPRPEVPVPSDENHWICQSCTTEAHVDDILCPTCGQVRADHQFTFTGKRRGSVAGPKMAGPLAKIAELQGDITAMEKELQLLRLEAEHLRAHVGEEEAAAAADLAQRDWELMYEEQQAAQEEEAKNEVGNVVKVEIPWDKLARLPATAMRTLFEYCDGDDLARIGLTSPYMGAHVDTKPVWLTLLKNLRIAENMMVAEVSNLKDMYAMTAHMQLGLFPLFLARKIETLKALGYPTKWCVALMKTHPNAAVDMAAEMLQPRMELARRMELMGYPMPWVYAALDACDDDLNKAVQHVAERVKKAQELEALGFDLVDGVEALLLKNNHPGDAALCLLEASVTGQSTADMMLEEEARANSHGVTLSGGNMTAAVSTVDNSWVTLFASAGYSDGVHTWGVQLDAVDVTQDLYIGIAAEGASFEQRLGWDQYGWGVLGAQVMHNAGNNAINPPYHPETLLPYDTLFLRLNMDARTLELGLMSQDWLHEESCEVVAVGLPDGTYHPAFSIHTSQRRPRFTLIANLARARARRVHHPLQRTDTQVAQALQARMWD